MRIDRFSFGTIRIDGETYEQDVVIDRGSVRLRKKKPSKQFRTALGHTPLSVQEEIPWKCTRLIIGTGAQVTAVRTQKAIELLSNASRKTNAVLHITC